LLADSRGSYSIMRIDNSDIRLVSFEHEDSKYRIAQLFPLKLNLPVQNTNMFYFCTFHARSL
jgi:hypothetical protein